MLPIIASDLIGTINSGMSRLLFLTTLYCGVHVFANSQIPNAGGWKDSAESDSIPELNSLLRTYSRAFGDSGRLLPTTSAFLDYVKDGFGDKEAAAVRRSFTVMDKGEPLTNFLDQRIKGFYSIAGKQIPSFQGRKFFENDIRGLHYEFLHQGTPGFLPAQSIFFEDHLKILGIPFDVTHSSFISETQAFGLNNLLHYKFNKDSLSASLKRQLQQSYNIEKFISADLEILQYFRSYFKSFLQKELDNLQGMITVDVTQTLNGLFSLEELMNLDAGQIRDRLLPPGDLKKRTDLITALNARINAKGIDINLRDSLLTERNFLQTQIRELEKLAAVIETVKKGYHGEIDIDRIVSLQKNIEGNLDSWLGDPSRIRQSARALLPQSEWQRLFSSLRKFDLGSIGVDNSNSTVSNLFISGLNLSSLKKGKAFGLGAGLSEPGGFFRDRGLNSGINAPSQMLQFLSFGRESETGAGNSLSIVNAYTVNTERRDFSYAALPRNTFVGSFTKKIDVRSNGRLEAEISKSSSQFRFSHSSGNDAIMEHNSALLMFGQDFLQTLSAGLRYSDEWKKIGLSHDFKMGYSGMGYNNPGNPQGIRGSFHYGINLRQQLPDRRGQISIRLSERSIRNSVDESRRWKNFHASLDGRYRFNRKITLGFRLQEHAMNLLTAESRQRMYVNRKIAVNGTASYNIGSTSLRSLFSMGFQQFQNEYTAHTGSQMWVIQMGHYMPLGSRMISANVFYNRETGSTPMIGDMLNADAGIQYQVGKIWQMSSAVTYLENEQFMQQLGLRQSVQGRIFRKIHVGLFADWRKDIRTPVRNYLYGNFRGDVSIYYSIQ